METISMDLIERLAKKYGTPFYMMYPDIYKRNISSFIFEFKKRYNRVIAGYSFKTNYVPFLCSIAKEMGCFAEVVSNFEFDLAKRLGFKNIIFNGPIKTKEILIEALECGAIVNLDSKYEVGIVCDYKKDHPDRKVVVGIRINIDLTNKTGFSHIQNGLKFGRFGFSKKQLEQVVKDLSSSNIDIVSIHGHTSSSDRAVANYKLITNQMLDICKHFNLNKIAYFDVGGGFFGAASKGIDVSLKPKYKDYANAILDIVLNDNWFLKIEPNIVIEPGCSVVSNVFSYVARLYQRKQIGEKTFITTDGSVFDVKPTMHSYNMPFKIFQRKANIEYEICDLVGSTCMEKDIILKEIKVPLISFGDYIKIDNVGSYTISLTPTFINYLSPIVCINDNEEIRLVRRRQTLDDVLEIYKK